MREIKEITKDLENLHVEVHEWFPHLGRKSARKKFYSLAKKDIELEKELIEALEQKYSINLKPKLDE
jgi:recombinational DNA repair protein RecR